MQTKFIFNIDTVKYKDGEKDIIQIKSQLISYYKLDMDKLKAALSTGDGSTPALQINLANVILEHVSHKHGRPVKTKTLTLKTLKEKAEFFAKFNIDSNVNKTIVEEFDEVSEESHEENKKDTIDVQTDAKIQGTTKDFIIGIVNTTKEFESFKHKLSNTDLNIYKFINKHINGIDANSLKELKQYIETDLKNNTSMSKNQIKEANRLLESINKKLTE